MPRLEDYPYLLDRQRRPVLPPELQQDILALSDAIRRNQDYASFLSAYLKGLEQLPVPAIVRAADEIRNLGNLFCRPAQKKGSWIFKGRSNHESTIESEHASLAANPALARFYIFHGDGRLRQAALNTLADPPAHPFAFVALVYRLNDWVPQIRDAAFDCANKLVPQTSPDVVAEASFFLFAQLQHLGRWGAREHDFLETTLYRPDVLQALAGLLMQRPVGQVGRVMRLALKLHGLDDFLPRLAQQAPLPHIRAVAYESLILRRARWFESYRREWIDKRYNLWRRTPDFQE